LSQCQLAVNLKPQDYSLVSARGYVYWRLERFNGALKDYEESLRMNPMNAHALYGRGKVRVVRGETTAGNADIESAKRIDPLVVEKFEGALASVSIVPDA
jgi:Flp pilus assembly protein TadD